VIDETLHALGEPHRRAILDSLRDEDRSVGELVALLGFEQPGMSKHLRVLRDAGLVDVRKDAQRRVYALRPEPMRGLDDWLRPYRERWNTSLDALARELDDEPDEGE
jgi:DNA-binding transcriptional ArsR family regulator